MAAGRLLIWQEEEQPTGNNRGFTAVLDCGGEGGVGQTRSARTERKGDMPTDLPFPYPLSLLPHAPALTSILRPHHRHSCLHSLSPYRQSYHAPPRSFSPPATAADAPPGCG